MGRLRKLHATSSSERSPRRRPSSPRWIHRLDWSEDRTRVRLFGPGYEVELSYDDQKVYARGTVPLAIKLLEGPVKAFIKQTLASES